MIYGLDRPFRTDDAAAAWPRSRYRAWRRLDAPARLKLVEAELKPAAELSDGFPLAL